MLGGMGILIPRGACVRGYGYTNTPGGMCPCAFSIYHVHVMLL